MIFYKDAEDNYQLIPNSYPYIDRFEFMLRSMSKVKREIPKEELMIFPSLTILGIPLHN